MEAVIADGHHMKNDDNEEKKSELIKRVSINEATGSLTNDCEDDLYAMAERLKEIKRDRKPLLYCRLITSNPKCAFLLTLSCHLLMVFLVVFLYVGGYNMFPAVFDRLPLELPDDVDYLRGLSWDYRNDDPFIISREMNDQQTESSKIAENIVWIYHSDHGNILTQENLQNMQTVEDNLYNDPQYKNNYCYRQNEICTKPSSILRFFDGTYSYADPVFYDPNYNNVVQVLYYASINNQTKTILRNFVGKDFTVNSESADVSSIRGYMAMTYPLLESDPLHKVTAYLEGDFSDKINSIFENGVGKMVFVCMSKSLISSSITKYVFQDMCFLTGSFFFIFIFIWIHTRSLWISGLAVFSIFTSSATSHLVYRVILDYRYMGVFHILALFIILGIGADDVFVFVDTWKETSHNKYNSLAQRMSDCYRRSSLAMMYTSLTTTIAFVVSSFSCFLGIRSFGVFAGILVFMNYLSVIFYFPTVVLIHHLYFDGNTCCCCTSNHGNRVQSDDGNRDNTHHRKNRVVRFFKGPYHSFVTHRFAKWCIMTFFIFKLTFFVCFATTIHVNEEQTKFLPTNTNIGKFILLSVSEFETGDNPQKVFIVFGLKPQSLMSCELSNATCYGNTVWDNDFNLNIPGSQEALMDLCNNILSLPEEKISELHIRKNPVTQQPEVRCFLKDLASFIDMEEVRNISGVARYPVGTDFSLPLGRFEAESFMTNVTLVYNRDLISNSYDRWFEIGVSFWLNNGFSFTETSQDFLTYNDLIGESEETYTITKVIPYTNELTYKYATRLRYVAIVVNTTINPNTLGFLKGLPIRDAWEGYVSQQVAALPSTLQGGYQTTPIANTGFNLWHWLKVQKILVSSAVLGVAIGVGLLFPILVIATRNIITGLLATLTISCITISVLGFIPILGWKLGMLESVNLVLVVGLAVDYCVHLAEGYSRSVHKDRKNRVKDALEEVGISVLSGCFTTLGASFFLFFGTILFFTQFGMFVFCTIGLSIIYSLGFFITVLGIMGPENDFGSLKSLCQRNPVLCTKWRNNQVSENE